MTTEQPHIAAIREAAQKLLAFATKAETISVWNVDGSDLRRVGDDLFYIAAEIVDPLILAYGDYCASHTHGLDLTMFEHQCAQALDGNALYEIRNAADMKLEELMQDAAE